MSDLLHLITKDREMMDGIKSKLEHLQYLYNELHRTAISLELDIAALKVMQLTAEPQLQAHLAQKQKGQELVLTQFDAAKRAAMMRILDMEAKRAEQREKDGPLLTAKPATPSKNPGTIGL